jgi:hypothetical protein
MQDVLTRQRVFQAVVIADVRLHLRDEIVFVVGGEDDVATRAGHGEGGHDISFVWLSIQTQLSGLSV